MVARPIFIAYAIPSLGFACFEKKTKNKEKKKKKNPVLLAPYILLKRIELFTPPNPNELHKPWLTCFGLLSLAT